MVGVDGSPASEEALRWAAHQAELTGASLRAVMTWRIPATAYGAMIPVASSFDLRQATEEALSGAVLDALGPDPQPVLEVIVVEGDPASVLIEQAQTADLLVVGSRGHGHLAGMLLGSVSERCVTHASCPVVVVHHTKAPRGSTPPATTGPGHRANETT